MRRRLAPPPRLTLSEWADRYRHLSRENSAEPGPWHTSRVPYLREIMDAVSDPDIPEMVIMKSAQVGFTEGVLGNAIGYFIDQDPAPILVVQPSELDAEDWSKRKLAPMLRDTPRLRHRVADAKSRTTDNTILSKSFPGGQLKATGATSPKGLRRMPARVVLLDEVDGYPASAGPEGDPISLARKRATTFWNRKIVLGSTPTTKGLSRIEKAFTESDQRYYHVPCPACGFFQVLRWGGREKNYGLKWEEDAPETAAYLCADCGVLIDEPEKAGMVAAGRWIATNPGSAVPGWHLNALISPFDGARWPQLVAEWLVAKHDQERLKVFVNTVLGETWEVRGEKVEPTALEARALGESWPAEVPRDVGLLTAGVDVQGDRLELAVKGWGAGEESWLITHQRLHGDPGQEEVWARLEHWLTKAYRHESGADLRIRCCMIDAGYLSSEVYRFVRPRERRNVFAARGLDETGRGRVPLSRASRANRDKVKVFTIGTVPMKDTLFSRLRVERPGPKYMHFCRPTDTGADAEYYAQFAAEKRVIERVKGGPVRKYVQVRDRNEAIDLEVLNLAALYALGQATRDRLGDMATALHAPTAPEAEEAAVEDDEALFPDMSRRSWVTRWQR